MLVSRQAMVQCSNEAGPDPEVATSVGEKPMKKTSRDNVNSLLTTHGPETGDESTNHSFDLMQDSDGDLGEKRVSKKFLASFSNSLYCKFIKHDIRMHAWFFVVAQL